MKLPFKKEDFLGNVRSGNKRENNSPRNLSYFDVHLDNYTSEYSVALFKSVTQENPSQLEIMPIDNIIITNEIYTKNFKCKGYMGKATRIVGNEGKQEYEPNVGIKLIEKLKKQYGTGIDVIVGDAIYLNEKVIKAVKKEKYIGVFRLKENNRKIYEDAKGLFKIKKARNLNIKVKK